MHLWGIKVKTMLPVGLCSSLAIIVQLPCKIGCASVQSLQKNILDTLELGRGNVDPLGGAMDSADLESNGSNLSSRERHCIVEFGFDVAHLYFTFCTLTTGILAISFSTCFSVIGL